MPRYLVLSRLTSTGQRLLLQDQSKVPSVRAEVEAAGGAIVDRFALLGDWQFCTIVDLPDAALAQTLGALQDRVDTTTRVVLPAIDVDLFVQLLGRSAQLTGPYRWQIRLPARAVRRLLRWFIFTRRVKQSCSPLTIEGSENFNALRGPAIFIGNHTSHLDTLVLHAVLPARYKRRLAAPSAADRFFVKGRKGITRQGWWYSLTANIYPLQRGGGRAALDYTRWLLDKGWSIVIFPEGGRSRSGKLGRFKAGPAMLAVEKGLPVVPIFMDGLHKIRPSGTREATPGPVRVKVGTPVRFPPGFDIGEATKQLERALQALADAGTRPESPRGSR
jgi:long-chain acyl-CoA synthetase